MHQELGLFWKTSGPLWCLKKAKSDSTQRGLEVCSIFSSNSSADSDGNDGQDTKSLCLLLLTDHCAMTVVSTIQWENWTQNTPVQCETKFILFLARQQHKKIQSLQLVSSAKCYVWVLRPASFQSLSAGWAVSHHSPREGSWSLPSLLAGLQ